MTNPDILPPHELLADDRYWEHGERLVVPAVSRAADIRYGLAIAVTDMTGVLGAYRDLIADTDALRVRYLPAGEPLPVLQGRTRGLMQLIIDRRTQYDAAGAGRAQHELAGLETHDAFDSRAQTMLERPLYAGSMAR